MEETNRDENIENIIDELWDGYKTNDYVVKKQKEKKIKVKKKREKSVVKLADKLMGLMADLNFTEDYDEEGLEELKDEIEKMIEKYQKTI